MQGRARRRRAALHDRLTREPAPTHVLSPADREHAHVHEALRRLGPRDREVLLLSEWEELTPTEIAAVVGCLTVTVRGRLHRARRRFRAEYEEVLARDGERRHDAHELRLVRSPQVREGGSSRPLRRTVR